MLLHDTEGYKLEEIHKLTGDPVGTIKSRLEEKQAALDAKDYPKAHGIGVRMSGQTEWAEHELLAGAYRVRIEDGENEARVTTIVLVILKRLRWF